MNCSMTWWLSCVYTQWWWMAPPSHLQTTIIEREERQAHTWDTWWSRKFHLISKNVYLLVALHVMINKVRGFIFWGLWRLLSLKWVVQLSTLMFSIDGQQTDGAESSRSPAASTVEKNLLYIISNNICLPWDHLRLHHLICKCFCFSQLDSCNNLTVSI